MNDHIQLHLFEPYEVNIDGQIDELHGIQYIGSATRQNNGKYKCLANVNCCLCIVEINLIWP